MRQDTLLFLLKEDSQEILLAMKKRGFGVGKLNGVGGKVGRGEKIEAAAVREAYEEIGVVIQEKDLVKTGGLTFHFEGKLDWDIHCHVFLAYRWAGKPGESEEMAPEWFDQSAIPFERMWIDDKYWLPTVLKGNYVVAEFFFNHDGSGLITYTINGVQSS